MPTPVPDELVERPRETAAPTKAQMDEWRSQYGVAPWNDMVRAIFAAGVVAGRREGIEAAAAALDDEGRVKAVRVVSALLPADPGTPSAPSEEATP